VAGKRQPDDRARAEYDFSAGERGRYAQRFAEGTNLIVLERDVAAMFPDSRSVIRERANEKRAAR